MSDDRSQSQPSGFKVEDRRRFNPDGSVRPEGETTAEQQERFEPAPSMPSSKASRASDRDIGPDFTRQPAGLNLSDFSGLILSLAQAAMIELGAAPDPSDGQVHRNVKMARQTIDTIAMLKEKTAGNRTPEETRLIDGALYQLRLAFVECCQGSDKGPATS